MEYSEYDLHKTINKDHIEIGIGLQKVDNLIPSQYFYTALEESKTYDDLYNNLKTHHADKKANPREKECDLVSVRIAQYLEQEGFSFSPITLKSIHKFIFMGAFPQTLEKYIGVFRDVNIEKKEEILGGKSVQYANYDEIIDMLDYDFSIERKKQYFNMKDDEKIENIASFISNIWQIHPFREGNTRTIAVFAIKYLNSKGFDINNDIFKEHSKYFRNALVVANYENYKENIALDSTPLQTFFKKFLIDNSLRLKTIEKK